jgi:hypothetical protein
MIEKVRWVRLLPALVGAACASGQTVEFNRDIRPILSDRCFTCHGPDSANRITKLRFDSEDGAKGDLGSGRRAIIPGDADASLMVQRITSKQPALRMPPVASGAALAPREIDLIRRWIAQGARWQKHWALIAPKRPEIPQVSGAGWPKNPIDHFVLERLEREGLRPTPEADRARLIRRVTLDLTGLPPAPADVDNFMNDRSANAYERVVDRLLASNHYGERMAIRWLDAARYADTNGYQTDAERFMWRWRDWVIDAFNRNMPFDTFTVEQIAGDMLPKARLDQKIATGFNRNHRGNGEGGIIPEEYAVEYVADRVETTSTVWLGLTVGCARCHDHKYDPISQREYYRMFAYFNNVPERGKVFKYGNSPPVVQAPTPDEQARVRTLDEKLASAEARYDGMRASIDAARSEWESSAATAADAAWTVSRDLAVDRPAEESFDGKRYVDAGNVANFGFYDKITLAAWIHPTAPDGAIVARTEDLAEGEGFGLFLKDGKLQANFVKRWLDDALRVETERELDLNRWHHVAVTYDGSRVADGVRFYIDGKPEKLRVLLDDLNQSFNVREPLRIGGGLNLRFRGAIKGVRVHRAALKPDEVSVLAVAEPVSTLAKKPGPRRAQAESLKLAWYFLERAAPTEMQKAWMERNRLRLEREALLEALPTVMVMEERPGLRDTFLLVRGAYDRQGEKVSPGVPSALPPLAGGAANNRLGFARWLVDPGNPLTARVVVNRFWAMYFGSGLVRTLEDFGSQGDWPSHPELLDWLATEFIRTGWDVKALQKTLVMSATYRQSTNTTPALMERDPENRLLARGPRFRLPAETVRDQALAISGLLVEQIGGPSVKPYQPPGLWKELSGGQDYRQDHGPSLYRRSLYTFWKRTTPPPGMSLFDAPSRESCVVRTPRTNTPLQALALMNDVTYVESARALGQRMMQEGGAKAADRIAFGFLLATARMPRPEELRVLLDGFQHRLDRFQSDRKAAVQLLSHGEFKHNQALDAAELAAYAATASLILNLDETLTKE